MKYEMLLKELK